MKNKPTNPFITGGYVSPDYFCDRRAETERLLAAIASNRNVTLISLRRMGKTGLLNHVRQIVENQSQSSSVIYIDLLPTMNGTEMLNTISTALIQVKQTEKNFFGQVLALLATLRPKLSYDSLTGQPSLELTTVSPAEITLGFSQLLTYISKIKKNLVFMFDEFQQIAKYPEQNMEQVLRSIIQTYPTIPFIFSGSTRHMLEPMFTAANRPFYQSSEMMYLNKISFEDYKKFMVEKFESGHKKIKDDALNRILDWTRLHTFYVQYVCNLLYADERKNIDNELINQTFQIILTSYEPLFDSYRNLIPPHQFKLLKSIAIENKVEKPTSGAFIQKHRLGSASSVITSLKALSEKEMIVKNDNAWQVYDVFFSRWLEYHYGER